MSTIAGFSHRVMKGTGVALSVCLYSSIATAHPAAAQRVVDETTQPVQMARPGVRYTTGMTQTKGWERQLVQNNANLRHWNWSPMVSYTQSMRGPDGSALAVAPRVIPLTPHYVKPIHIPLPLSEIHMADLNHQVGLTVSSGHESVSASLRQGPRPNRDVFGHLVNPPILSYGPNSARSNIEGSLTSEDVHGVIRSR
jgi:hypothetical protein